MENNEIVEKYVATKSAKKGAVCVCPSCNTEFIKEAYQQAFCKSKPGTECKDFYWNAIRPNRRAEEVKNNSVWVITKTSSYEDEQLEILAIYDTEEAAERNKKFYLQEYKGESSIDVSEIILNYFKDKGWL